MARSPQFKVYRQGEYIGCVKHPIDAAALINVAGEGQVRFNHRHIIWHEGREQIEAGESYDIAADIMLQRIADLKNDD